MVIDLLQPFKPPSPDTMTCSCGWSGHFTKAEAVEEGDWETGYWTAYECPSCDDSDDIDWSYSPEQQEVYDKWMKDNTE